MDLVALSSLTDWLRFAVILQAVLVAGLYIWNLPKEVKGARTSATEDARYVYWGRVWGNTATIFACVGLAMTLTQLIIVDAPFIGSLVVSQLALIGFALYWAFAITRRELQSPEGKQFSKPR